MQLGVGLGLMGLGRPGPDRSNLFAWYDADFQYTLATGVSQLNDLSGNGRNVVQATGAKQPSLNVTDAAYNGHNTLSFAAASSQNLVCAAQTLAQPCTVYIVGEDTNSGANGGFLDTGGIGIFGNSSLHAAYYAGSVQASSTLVSGKSVICAVFNHPGSASGLYVNSSSAAVSSGDPGSAGFSSIGIGGQNVITNFLTGKIASVLVFSVAHSQQQRYGNMRYLGSKYGVAVS